ncbi:MAG: hypothetical protein QOH96_2035 [Blastocatellia bacterium]|nr:hypothetical protein [Blastocatellia bacterium]
MGAPNSTFRKSQRAFQSSFNLFFVNFGKAGFHGDLPLRRVGKSIQFRSDGRQIESLVVFSVCRSSHVRDDIA